MIGNEETMQHEWTSTVEATLPSGIDVLWSTIYSALGKALSGRAPIYKTKKNEPWLKVYFGVEGETIGEANKISKELVERAFGEVGIPGVLVECVGIESNEVLDQDIAHIDNSGNIRLEANIIPFISQKED